MFHQGTKHNLLQWGADFSAGLLVGADLLRMSREDLIQICGPADGIRLFNSMKGRWDRVGAEKGRPSDSFCGDIAVLAVAAHIFQVYSAPSDHLCVSAAGQNSISHQAGGWRRYVRDRNNSLGRDLQRGCSGSSDGAESSGASHPSLQSTRRSTWMSWPCRTCLRRSLYSTASLHSKLRTFTNNTPTGSTY